MTRRRMQFPTQEELKAAFTYSGGVLMNLPTRKGTKAFAPAYKLSGTRLVVIWAKQQLPHAYLVFLYHHGYSPDYVHHINGNPVDDRIENLSGAVGVVQHGLGYRATRRLGDQVWFLGDYASHADAMNALQEDVIYRPTEEFKEIG